MAGFLSMANSQSYIPKPGESDKPWVGLLDNSLNESKDPVFI